jgi:hypothetical protein
MEANSPTICWWKRHSCSMITTESGAKMPRNQVHSPNQVSRVQLFCIHLLMAMIGSRVRLSKDRLRAQYLPQGAACSYARVIIEDRLAGNVFACRWTYNGKTVCWVTQLVVHRDFRERGIAVSLLNQMRQDDDELYGLMSSHPAACLAAAKAFGSKCIIYFIHYESGLSLSKMVSALCALTSFANMRQLS